MNETALLIQIEKARNELRYAANQIAAKYGLSGGVFKLILQNILADETQQQLSLLCEEINVMQDKPDEEKQEEDDNGGEF